jgi:regulator of sirC expression with transglutaminase-like and TPR domain
MNSKFSLYKTRVWLVALFIALITVLVYLPALQNGFVNWDDDFYIYKNYHIQYINFAFFKWMFTTFHASNWHPLTWLSHALDHAIWGLNPMGHHLTNIILHGLNTFLVVLIIICLINYANFTLSPLIKGNPSIIAGAFTGLLFGIHPLHVESVAWVSERKDLLYAFFYLLSILSYLKYTSSQRREFSRHPSVVTHYWWYSLCVIFFILSLMSKPMAVTLPAVLILLDIYPLERLNLKSAFTSRQKVLIEKIPFIVLSLASSVITIIAQKTGGAVAPLETFPPIDRILVAFSAICFYLLKIVWPSNLAPLYQYPSNISFLTLKYMGSLILVVCITAFCIWLWKRHKVFLVAWAYYIVTLLPVSGIIQVGSQSAADRYAYLPSLGPFFLVGLAIISIWKSINLRQHTSKYLKLFFLISLISLAGFLSITTVKQIKIWRDSLTLWNYELELFPEDAPKAYYLRGEAYEKLGNYNQALDDFKKSIELNPYYESGYMGRGILYAKSGNYQQAIEDFDHAIRINPNDSDLYYNRGLSYKLIAKYQKAIQDFDKAIQLNPQNIDAYVNREMCYMELYNKK